VADIVVHLRRPEELLVVDPLGLFDECDGDAARTVPGIDELFAALLGRRAAKRGKRVVLTLPAAVFTEDAARRLVAAVARWRGRRAEQIERDGRVLRRLGLRSLPPGIVLFLVGLLLSTDFLEPDVPEFFQQVLGNGVFSVVAWVGLWYPFDLLFFARLPLRRERRALRDLARMRVDVLARDR
jgi:hypothetical protein